MVRRDRDWLAVENHVTGVSEIKIGVSGHAPSTETRPFRIKNLAWFRLIATESDKNLLRRMSIVKNVKTQAKTYLEGSILR
ncbi:MAG: hypothetical protein CM1200mP40_24160 [Gammaproteobacteria bacterium]|nr:MAG: hypothetical protein CM1200mP40_24160 [Gammaproteobacteria bacterium]